MSSETCSSDTTLISPSVPKIKDEKNSLMENDEEDIIGPEYEVESWAVDAKSERQSDEDEDNEDDLESDHDVDLEGDDGPAMMGTSSPVDCSMNSGDDTEGGEEDDDEDNDPDYHSDDTAEKSPEEDDDEASSGHSDDHNNRSSSGGDKETGQQQQVLEFDGHEIQVFGNRSKCPVCSKLIKSTFILRHYKHHRNPIVPQKCPEKDCQVVFSRPANLIRHLKAVHKVKQPYICKFRGHSSCEATFSKARALRQHVAAVHPDDSVVLDHPPTLTSDKVAKDRSSSRHVCEFPGCGRSYGKRHHLAEHERKHRGEMRFSCEVCGKRFFVQAHMKRHLYSHTGVKPHVCRWKCGAVFASYGGRMKHERINHYDRNPLQEDCGICGRPFRNVQQLIKHRLTHLNPAEREDHRCAFCHIMLDTIKLKDRHEERHREGDRFQCETCLRCFKNEKNLSYHLRTNHHGPEELQEDQQQKSKPRRRRPSSRQDTEGSGSSSRYFKTAKHECHLCGPPKMYGLSTLRRHLARIHSQNFKCYKDGCQKTFQEKARLEAHEHVHRMRECHLCGRTFQRKQNVDIHLIGVHNLSGHDLEALGRLKAGPNGHSPDYFKGSGNVEKNKKKKRRKQSTTIAEITIKEEPLL